MSRIYLCFLWHMHQPFYKDLVSGEYRLPWTRLHALKDYYGMVQLLEEFPSVHQTFNLVPSMMVQVEEYASGEAVDPFLAVALKPAEGLTDTELEFLLRNSFHAFAPRMIYRYPRYGELYEARQAQRGLERLRRVFGAQEIRDLQVLSQLAWFDEMFFEKDREVQALAAKGRGYNLEDQKLMGQKQREILAEVMPAYRRIAGRGQVEISTTPYYHPILPLLCDSNIASVSHPNVALPPRFRYPQDARRQLEMARSFMEREFGAAPAGLWPSEGSVSDEVFAIASELGFAWTATDSGVLARTLSRATGVDAIYRPYRWEQGGKSLKVIFRDHFLSDLIGFVYSGMGTAEAAGDFLNRIRENCRPILAGGRDALVPIILDGENAWEYYERNGRPFLRELYRQISGDDQMIAATISEALAKLDAERLNHIFPGSWINANFDVWIGAEEDNQAWTHLSRAREAYEQQGAVPEERRRMAYEELLIAEGSDWCWWYGPEHASSQRQEFDQLYRSHLANIYKFLGLNPPEELSRPILRIESRAVHLDPSGSIHPTIDGEVTSYFEWIGAGLYRADERSGSMHGKKILVRELHFGTDGVNLFLRLDPGDGMENAQDAIEARLILQGGNPAKASEVTLRIDRARIEVRGLPQAETAATGEAPVECAYRRIVEVRISLAALGVTRGAPLRFQCSLWQGGLPMDAIPQQGWVEMTTTEPAEWAA